MKVSLVSLTQPAPSLQAQGIKTAEDLIVHNARVSNPANAFNVETGPKLIRYLLKHGHYSPLEQASLGVEVETSRAVAAQVLRHWSINVQEFSQRYATADLGFETYEARRQDPINRQNSIDDLPAKDKDWFLRVQKETYDRAAYYYQHALSLGIAKEQARMLLPLSTTTRMFLTATCRDWFFYLKARLDPATQLEHRQVAEAIRTVFAEQFPTVARALETLETE